MSNDNETVVTETADGSWKKRVALIATGHAFNETFDYIYNYALYIPAIALLGPLYGGLLMTVGDIVFSLLFILFYDWLKKDWLGIEVAKELVEVGPEWLRERSEKSRWHWWLLIPFRFMAWLAAWALKKGKVATFIVMSIQTDPFITTVMLRDKAYGGMGRKDWMIFFASAILSNAWWTGQIYIGILLVEFGWAQL